jgi:hypothetical protein
MQRLLRKLRREGVRFSDLQALEVFGSTGERHVLDYVGRVKSLEVWEIDASCEAALRLNLPGAEIKITDSFAEAVRSDRRYGFVVVDNPTGTYGGGRCEHFDLFPDLFRLLDDQAVVVIDVLSKLSRRTRRKFPHLLDDQHLARRRAFYQTDAEDLSLNAIAAHYRTLFEKAGFAVDSAILQRRRYVHYLALKVHRHQARPLARRRFGASPGYQLWRLSSAFVSKHLAHDRYLAKNDRSVTSGSNCWRNLTEAGMCGVM